MVYFHTKIPIFDTFWKALERIFLFNGHLVYFCGPIRPLVYFSRFCVLKNPATLRAFFKGRLGANFAPRLNPNMLIKSIVGNNMAMFSPKNITYTPAGFEPGFSDPQANAMFTAPRRHGG
jgi:hypothetical protein